MCTLHENCDLPDKPVDVEEIIEAAKKVSPEIFED
jgi:hypothetical protein